MYIIHFESLVDQHMGAAQAAMTMLRAMSVNKWRSAFYHTNASQ